MKSNPYLFANLLQKSIVYLILHILWINNRYTVSHYVINIRLYCHNDVVQSWMLATVQQMLGCLSYARGKITQRSLALR